MTVLVPGFKWVTNARNGGGTYGTDFYPYPWRLLMHTMEGWLSEGTAGRHPYPPHLWYSPRTRERFQTVPLDRSAFALYQDNNGEHYTNKACCIQVEIEGWASEASEWPQAWLDYLVDDVVVPIIVTLRTQLGGDINLSNIADIGAIPGSANAYAPQRMLPESEWADFDGLCSHRHVPQNDHWDTGGLNLHYVAWRAAKILNPPEPPPPPVVLPPVRPTSPLPIFGA